MNVADYPKFFDHTITVETADHIATITIDCPEIQNNITEQLMDEFHQAIQTIHYDDEIRVIVLRSNSENFFGSGDGEKLLLNRILENKQVGRQILQRFGAVVHEMRECGKIIISCMDGHSIGGGCGLTLASDIIFATKKAGFQPMIHAYFGLVPDCGGMYNFARLCGPQKAMWYALRPDPVTAEEAYKDGLIAKLFDDAETMYQDAYALAAYIANCPPYGVYNTKAMAVHAAEMDFDTYAIFESEMVASGAHTQDYKTAVEAFYANDPSKRTFAGY